MRKAVSVIIVFCLILFNAMATAYAENAISFSVSMAEGKPGDTVMLTVSMEENTGVAYLAIPVIYNEESLELKSFTGTGLDGWTIGKNAVWVDAENSNYTGEILTMRFTIKDSAESGLAEVTVGPVEAWTATDDEVDVAVSTGGVMVEDGHTHSWREPVWTWADDGFSVSAAFACTACGLTKESEASVADGSVKASLVMEETAGERTARSFTGDDGISYNVVTCIVSVVGPDGETFTEGREVTGLFAGWFRDPLFSDAFSSQPGTDDVKYPKLVDPLLLRLAYQVMEPTFASDKETTLRLITATDSLQYQKTGFVMQSVAADGAVTEYNQRIESDRVYKKLTGSDSGTVIEYRPREAFRSSDAQFFSAFLMKVKQAQFTAEMRFVPFWMTKDGTMVYGTPGSITVTESSSFRTAER